jgi:hypothetical protein
VTAGVKQNSPLWVYLREPLARAFGKEWYDKLRWSAEEYSKNKVSWERQ